LHITDITEPHLRWTSGKAQTLKHKDRRRENTMPSAPSNSGVSYVNIWKHSQYQSFHCTTDTSST